MKRLFFALILLYSVSSYAQSDISANGFLQYLETVTMQNFSGSWVTYSSVANRLDFRWYPSYSLQVHVGMRNIFDYGTFIQLMPGYADMVTRDDGYLNMTYNLASDTSYVFYSNFDRLNLQFTEGDLDIIIGRQRVNWGVNYVWTPNDIFNSFSYLNFDYEERPGSDAVKIEYYTGMASSIQFVAKVDREKEVTAAAMYKLNKWNYDMQAFAGIMEDDYVIGGGWSGDISSAGFNGEMTYFRDREKFNDTTGIFVASIGANYTFPSSLYLHSAFLYNSNGKLGKAGGNLTEFTGYNAKNLSFGRYGLFAQASYQISPLLKANVASIINPSDGSFFIGPNIDYSLVENIYILFMTQLFYGQSGTEYGDFGKYFYLRLKWNF